MDKSICKTNEYGDKHWYQNDKLHRVDGPATEFADGDKHWYQNGERHRVDGPAIEYANGGKHWYQNGKLHRVDGPAIEYANGAKHWYQNGIECKPHTCAGEVIEYKGAKYKLTPV